MRKTRAIKLAFSAHRGRATTRRNRFYADENVKFNSKQWVTTLYFRRAMLADFLKRHPIIGMTRKEVKKRLGPPWRTGADPVDDEYTDTAWYLLDGGFNGNAQTESFEIAYAKGKVTAYRRIACWQQ